MRLLRSSTSQPLLLNTDAPLGAGGEARIYAVPGHAEWVAKVYHRPTYRQAQKLAAMLANPPDDPSAAPGQMSIAWPLDTLNPQGEPNRVVGYLMPRAGGVRPIFSFYNPLTRRQESPLSNYLYLHRTARNLAAAVRALHARGYVIGDVNESNILVTETALVTLVDTDSFQVRDPHTGQIFRCPVGKPEFTPPELQGKTFLELDRTPEQDLFGLAILIFQLLMEGTHPFAGIYLGSDDPPSYDVRIAAGHFPYGTRKVPYRPMPAAPPVEILHPTVRHLFARCFEDGHNNPQARPDAQTWQTVLMEAENALVSCPVNPQHRFGSHLDACPWCARTKLLGGRDPFPTPDAAPRYRRTIRRRPQETGNEETRKRGVAAGTSAPARSPVSVTPNTQHQSSHASMGIPNAPLSYVGSYATPVPNTPAVNFPLPKNTFAWCALILGLMTALPRAMYWAGPISILCGLIGWRQSRQPGGDGKWLAISGAAAGALIWLGSLAIATGNRLIPVDVRSLEDSGPVSSVVFSPDGAWVAGGSQRAEDERYVGGEVIFWNTRDPQERKVLASYAGDVSSLAFSPDGKRIAIGSGSPLGTGEARIWNARTGQIWRTLTVQPPRYVQTVAFSPDGKTLACGSRGDMTIRLWDVESGTMLQEIGGGGEVFSVAYSPDGRFLAAGSGSATGSINPGKVRVWDTKTGQLLWTHPGHSTGVLTVAFSPDSKTLATGGYDNAIRLWNAADGKILGTMEGHGNWIACVAFSPDSKTLASCGQGSNITLWDIATRQEKRALTGHEEQVNTVAFSPDGKTLASGSRDRTVRLWKLSAFSH